MSEDYRLHWWADDTHCFITVDLFDTEAQAFLERLGCEQVQHEYKRAWLATPRQLRQFLNRYFRIPPAPRTPAQKRASMANLQKAQEANQPKALG